MTLRRLPAALPLAVLVAVIAHVASVGFEHAPGGGQAAALLGALGLSLLGAIFAAFFSGAVGMRSNSIATSKSVDKTPYVLAGGGFAAYVAIEFFEGHLALGSALRALAAVLPVALAVAWGAHALSSAAVRAGATFASCARERGSRAAQRYARRPEASPPRAPHLRARDVSRGRAPPHFA